MPDNKIKDEETVDEVQENSDLEEATEETMENSETVENEEEDLEKEEKQISDKSQKSGKNIFKKDKKEKKDKKDIQIDELNDKLIRNMAEFDNFRKRSEKEKSQMFEIGARDIIEKILPVIDNFERGLASITEEEKEGAFAQGIEKIYKQLITTLEESGVKQIEAIGKEFDPEFHNAVMHSEDENLGENIISDEFQKGYMYRDTVVRHSMVKVVN